MADCAIGFPNRSNTVCQIYRGLAWEGIRRLFVKKFAVCPICGQKLCKAEAGSVVEMVCPGCKQQVEVIVSQTSVTTKKCETKAV